MADEFDTLLASRPTDTGDEFGRLLARFPAPRRASIPGAEAYDEATGALEPAAPAAPRQQLTTAENLIGGTGDAIDLIWASTFAPLLGFGKEAAVRTQGAVESFLGLGPKVSRRELDERAATARNEVITTHGQPIRDLLTGLGILPKGESFINEKAMPKVASAIEGFSDQTSRMSHGALSKEDVSGTINMLMGAAGLKGGQLAAKSVVDRTKAKQVVAELERLKTQRQAEALDRETGGTGDLSIAEMYAGPRGPQARVEPTMDLEPARQIFADEPRLDPAARSEALKRVLQEDVAARARGEPGTWDRSAPSPARPFERETPPYPAGASDAADLPTQRLADGEQTTVAQPRGGPDLALPAAAATGLGLAALLAPDEREKALAAAAGVGALAVGRGRGLTLAAMQTMPDATPLRTLLDQSGYTFSTLEKLPSNRFEFSRQQITDLLKRQEVTKMERDVFESALAALPEGPVTAKGLMVALKQATGDFELGVRKTDEFADYGLDAIGRASRDVHGGYTLPEGTDVADVRPSTTRIYQSPLQLGSGNHFSDPNYFAHTRSFEEGGVRHVVEVQSDLAQKLKVLSPEETAATQKSLAGVRAQLESFRGRFGTRQEAAQAGPRGRREGLPRDAGPAVYSTTRGMARALQEIAREVAPHNPDFEMVMGEHLKDSLRSLQGLSGEQAFRTSLADLRASHAVALQDQVQKAMQRAVNLYTQRLRLLIDEHQSSLARSQTAGGVAPMLKNWYKRIIREEVVDAAGSGKSIRFADADTVAKVEGWPKVDRAAAQNLTDRVRGAEADLARAEEVLVKKRERNAPEHEILEREGAVAQARVTLGTVKAELARTGGLDRTYRDAGHQGIYDRYAGDLTKFLKQLGGTHIVDAQGHGWWEIPLDASNKSLPAGGLHGIPGRSRLQMGAASPEMQAAIAFFGGGAALGAILSDPGEKGEGALRGAAYGAAGLVGLHMLAKSRTSGVAAAAKDIGERASYFAGVLSHDIKQTSPELLRRLTRHVKGELKGQHDRLLQVAPFVEGLRTLPAATREALDLAWKAGNRAGVVAALRAAGKPQVIADLRQALGVRAALEGQLRASGRLQQALPPFPQVIVDVRGLLDHLEKDAGSRPLAKAIHDMSEKALRETGEPLSPFDIETLLGKSGLNPNQYARFYASASEALPLWIRAATRELERIRFLDTDLVMSKKTGLVNMSASIQNIVNRELAKGKMTLAEGDRLRKQLLDRFGPGERPAPAVVQTYKNVVYTALLSNPIATVTQLSDVPLAAAVHGMMPTIKALQAITTRSASRWTLADMGLVNHLVEEMLGGTKKPLRIGRFEISSARILEKALNYGDLPIVKHLSFSAADQLGKLVHLNAAAAKFQKLARSTKGQAEIARLYGDYFGADLGALMSDLRTGGKTPLVGELLFRELSDVQPLTRLEVPQAYLAHPGGRLAYTLKSFVIRQINLMVDRGISEIRKGDAASVKRGSAFLMRYMLALGAAGASADFIKDLLMGRRPSFEGNDIAENMLKGWGWSSYTLDKLRKEGPAAAAASLVVPPWKLFDEIARGDPKAMQYLPWVGKLYYNWMMGGGEDSDVRKAKRDAKAARAAEMSPEERTDQVERLREARERRRERALENLR